MATIFNSRIAKRIVAEDKKIKPESKLDLSAPVADKIYGPEYDVVKHRTEPRFADGRSVRSFFEELLKGDEMLTAGPEGVSNTYTYTDRLGQNRGILEFILRGLSLSGPDAQAEKRKHEANKRKASRMVFNAAREDNIPEDGMARFDDWANISQDYVEPDDLAGQDESHAMADQTNIGEGSSGLADDSFLKQVMRQYGLTNLDVFTKIPDIDILLPSGSSQIELARPPKGSKISCDDPGCPHIEEDAMRSIGIKPSFDKPRRCDVNQMVCTECHNKPMKKGDACATCDRKGRLSPDQSKKTDFYDPNSEVLGQVIRGITNVPKTAEPSEDLLADADKQFGIVPFGETSYEKNLDALLQLREEQTASSGNSGPVTESGGLDNPAAYEAEHLDPNQQSSAYSAAETEPEEQEDLLEKKKPVKPTDKFVQDAAETLRLKDHDKSCTYGCVSGSLSGANSAKARKRIKQVYNDPSYYKAIAEAKKNTAKMVKRKQLSKDQQSAVESEYISSIQQQYFQCPDLPSSIG